MRWTGFITALLGLLPSAPVPAQAGGLLQQFLDKSKTYAATPKIAHTPKFNLEPLTPKEHAKGTEWFYIRDGQERIGLIQTWIKEIEMFRFFPSPDGKGENYEFPEIYHWANLFGCRIQMYGTQGLPPVTSFKLTFTKERGDSLEFKVEHKHQGNINGSGEFRLVWDDRLGYVWHCTSRYTMNKPRDIEFNNLLAGGISDSRESHKRWQKTLRACADGRTTFVHHSPVNIPRNDIQAGGFVGFVTEEVNPFVELIETSSPVRIDTCSQWYDQHIIMKPTQTKGADGLYQAQVRYRFLSLPKALAQELEASAVPDNPATGKLTVTGFLQNQVNDFETPVPYGQVYNGPIWQHIGTTDEYAHSGKRSIKLNGQGPGKVKSASPIGGGPAVYGESNKRYRLAGWVKTQGLKDGGAYLEIDDVFWNWKDVRDTRRTKKLTGDQDWTRLEVEFTPSKNDPLFLIKLCVEGTGAAWFDDLELMEVKK